MPTIVKGIDCYYQTTLTDEIDYDDPTYNAKLKELQKEQRT